MASQMLRAANVSAEAVVQALEEVIAEIKAVHLLTGSHGVAELAETRTVFTGPTREWAASLGLREG
jgi:isopentenyl diphosphate isomerase/L-lactate dehydrogenase-like FMN-dependent dehydrogenase